MWMCVCVSLLLHSEFYTAHFYYHFKTEEDKGSWLFLFSFFFVLLVVTYIILFPTDQFFLYLSFPAAALHTLAIVKHTLVQNGCALVQLMCVCIEYSTEINEWTTHAAKQKIYPQSMPTVVLLHYAALCVERRQSAQVLQHKTQYVDETTNERVLSDSHHIIFVSHPNRVDIRLRSAGMKSSNEKKQPNRQQQQQQSCCKEENDVHKCHDLSPIVSHDMEHKEKWLRCYCCCYCWCCCCMLAIWWRSDSHRSVPGHCKADVADI